MHSFAEQHKCWGWWSRLRWSFASGLRPCFETVAAEVTRLKSPGPTRAQANICASSPRLLQALRGGVRVLPFAVCVKRFVQTIFSGVFGAKASAFAGIRNGFVGHGLCRKTRATFPRMTELSTFNRTLNQPKCVLPTKSLLHKYFRLDRICPTPFGMVFQKMNDYASIKEDPAPRRTPPQGLSLCSRWEHRGTNKWPKTNFW
jgi:hypothetical protein